MAFGELETPVGPVQVACTDSGVSGVGFGAGDWLRERYQGHGVVVDPERVAPALHQLAEYFAGVRREFELPVDWHLASRLQRQVLGVLYETVRFGEVVTYGELAARSGSGAPARAIGSVLGANPLPIIVPCHRVVSGSGLGGYSGGTGVEVKRWLLTLEGAVPPTLDWAMDG